jgi:hypothetical protein
MNVSDKEPHRNPIEFDGVVNLHEADKYARFAAIIVANRGIGQRGSKKP